MQTPCAVLLEPTATASRRIAVWVPTSAVQCVGRLGVISFDQRGRMESDFYEVEEWPAREASTRRFNLKKVAGDKSENVVQVGVVSHCTCPAGQKGARRQCKHRDAMSALSKEPIPDYEPLDLFNNPEASQAW